MGTLATANIILRHYFEAWEQQDSPKLVSLFSKDSFYKIESCGMRKYEETGQLRYYRETHPAIIQVNPQPKLLKSVFIDDRCIAEWENTFTTLSGNSKITHGMFMLELKSGLIDKLREYC